MSAAEPIKTSEAQDSEILRMSLIEHLEELRRRLIYALIAVGVAFLVCYAFAKEIFDWLMKPLARVLPPGSSLIFTGLTEAFFTYMKVAFIAALFLASPVILYQVWKFVAPGLYNKEKKYVLPFVFFASIFFVGGAMFGYFIVFPYGFKYLMGFASDYIRPFPSVKEYLSLATSLLFAFGIIFEMPLLSFLLARMGLVTRQLLAAKRKYAIVLAFMLGAILTPTPDVFNQLLMTGPLIILYEISIIVAWIFGKKKKEEIPLGEESSVDA